MGQVCIGIKLLLSVAKAFQVRDDTTQTIDIIGII